MKASILYRAAAVLLVLFAVGHTVGFRQSARYTQWREALHAFYEPFPTVQHYGTPL